jgi:hypothetical protein
MEGQNLDLTCTFTVAEIACLEQHIQVTYTGNAPETAIYAWDFGDAQVLSGSGQGPYIIRWITTGEKHITLAVSHENLSCTYTRTVIVRQWPEIFTMTGGGVYPNGGEGVHVGLSGSQQGVVYKLYRGENYTGISKVGDGEPIDFGLLVEPGTYTCMARWDGSDCSVQMEGTAVVVVGPNFNDNFLCMVSYDTASLHNLVVLYKPETSFLSKYMIYRETWQNNMFEKIAEIPYSSFSAWPDTTSDPLVRSYRYRVSVADTNEHEYEKCAPHKTVHLSIIPGLDCYNLLWNHYEGFEFLTYRIYRKIDTGPFEVIDSVASNVDSYTDFSVGGGIATYYIEIIKPFPCNPWKSSPGFESVISNIASAVPYGVKETNLEGL